MALILCQRRSIVICALLASGVLFGFFPVKAFAGETINLNWSVIPEAVQYEIEISAGQTKKPLIDQVVKDPEITVELDVGSYSYRVRTFLKNQEAGPWTDYLDFVLNTSKIKLLAPLDKSKFDLASGTKVGFRWNPGPAGSKYHIQIMTGRRIYFEKTVETPSFDWLPPSKGVIHWRVGYENSAEETWSETRGLRISDSALDKIQAHMAAPSKSAYRMQTVISFAPEVTNYNAQFPDVFNSVMSTTLSDTYAADFLWYKNSAIEPKGISAGAGLELRRQEMVHTTSFLPRLSARVAYTWGNDNFGYGPVVAIGEKSVGLFVEDSQQNYSSGQVWRTNASLGMEVYTRGGKKLLYTAAFLIGGDFGGSSSLASSNLDSTIAYEARLSVILKRPDHPLSFNMTYEHEALQWSAIGSGANSFNMTNLIFSFGFYL